MYMYVFHCVKPMMTTPTLFHAHLMRPWFEVFICSPVAWPQVLIRVEMNASPQACVHIPY